METYFILSPKLEAVKIGRSDRLYERFKALQAASPDNLVMIGTVDGDREYEFHNRFVEYRVKLEWFSMGPKLKTFLETKFGPIEKLLEPPPAGLDLSKLLTLKQVAACFHITEREAARLKGLRFVLIQGIKYYREWDLNAYVDDHTECPSCHIIGRTKLQEHGCPHIAR